LGKVCKNCKNGSGAGDGLRTHYLNLGKVALYSGRPRRPSSNSVAAVFCQGPCCGAQPHSIVFPCSCQPPKSFPPVNLCGRRLLLFEPTERLIQWNDVAAASRIVATEYALQSHEDRGPAGQVAVLKQPADKRLDNGQRAPVAAPALPLMPQGRFTASLGRAAGWLPGELRASASPRPGSCTTGQATGQSTGLIAMDKGRLSCFRS
jgi:hypothetical protein